MTQKQVHASVNLTIALPPEYFGILTTIDEMAIAKGITRSVMARELLTKVLDFTPKIERKLYVFKTEPKRVIQRVPRVPNAVQKKVKK